jgi:hypothetical protein
MKHKQKQQNDTARRLAGRLLMTVLDEMDDVQVRHTLRQKIVHPLLAIAYVELYPYILAAVCVIALILIISAAVLATTVVLAWRHV